MDKCDHGRWLYGTVAISREDSDGMSEYRARICVCGKVQVEDSNGWLAPTVFAWDGKLEEIEFYFLVEEDNIERE